MKRHVLCVCTLMLFSAAHMTLAQQFEVSSLDHSASQEADSPILPPARHRSEATPATERYATDVEGKRVRIIGPDLYAESALQRQLDGRERAMREFAGRQAANR